MSDTKRPDEVEFSVEVTTESEDSIITKIFALLFEAWWMNNRMNNRKRKGRPPGFERVIIKRFKCCGKCQCKQLHYLYAYALSTPGREIDFFAQQHGKKTKVWAMPYERVASGQKITQQMWCMFAAKRLPEIYEELKEQQDKLNKQLNRELKELKEEEQSIDTEDDQSSGEDSSSED